MEQKKRAWLYCRIDAPEDIHGALKAQQKELWDYAEHLGYEVAGASEDLGSGLEMERPGLTALLSAASEERVDTVMIKGLSRIGRSMKLTLDFLRELHSMGITLYSTLEGELRPSQDDQKQQEP
ncbi:recombinase family protein [Clostridium sp. HBUAS56010]|uniref:recombinase family protein n=1 Tax=Clostridium sp. HBUAS56010 TaxID=2571127 RepID=UPI0011778346|nr:recombinase family protein [Clostridium sp. HBUAS56010]